MKKEEIYVRDPFVLEENGTYYLYGTRGICSNGKCTGLDVYVSTDLENWSEPHEAFTRPADFWADEDFWAPEVHAYNGRYYMFVSFKAAGHCRATQILAADSPMGPFLPHSDGPVTPADWECLDGTLYVSKKGTPYMVFCHEWVQIKDGEICAVELTADLKAPAGEPFVLLNASSCPGVVPVRGEEWYVTDGPFMHRLENGQLLMLWSSFSEGGYCEIISYSDNGEIDGKWLHKKDMLFSSDGGHGMLFRTKEGQLQFVMHAPNRPPEERPAFIPVAETADTIAPV